jgi:tRNA dimethylallyltransferase
MPFEPAVDPPPAGFVNSLRRAVQSRYRLGPAASDQGEELADRPHLSAVIIAGPTASGKSALALELAAALDGTIINADSQQIYRDLKILSARPDAAALRRVPHRLYGFLDAAERGSVGRWRGLALAEIAAAQAKGSLPFLVGGTGLYLRAVQHGLAAIPPIPAAIRAEAAMLHDEIGGTAFRERLIALDPAAAARLPSGDRQRLLRAWEVVRATGRPLGDWQQGSAESAPCRFATVLMMSPREALYAACDARFAAMIAKGGVEEAAALVARGLAPDLPAMKAVGVPELLRYLRGEIGLAEALAAGQRATRRYAKRQMTWFRHQIVQDLILDQQISEALLHQSRDFIERFRLTGSA